jgi:hypothetical protein
VRDGLSKLRPPRQTRVRRSKSSAAKSPPRARLQLGEERRLERVEAHLRVAVERERVGLDGARQRMHAEDRARRDGRARLGPLDLAARDHRVRVRLQRGVAVERPEADLPAARAAGSAAAIRPPSDNPPVRRRSSRRRRSMPDER